jgi:hypothetical protein
MGSGALTNGSALTCGAQNVAGHFVRVADSSEISQTSGHAFPESAAINAHDRKA